MAQSGALNRSARTRRRSRRWNLLVLAGLPLVVLHLAFLMARATHPEGTDAVVAIRWVLSIALLVLLRRGLPRLRSLQSPAVAVSAILIFALIHAPAAAPEPGLPLAATGMGLALSLAVVDRRCGSLVASLLMDPLAQPSSLASSLGVTRETLKDRAPPASR